LVGSRIGWPGQRKALKRLEQGYRKKKMIKNKTTRREENLGGIGARGEEKEKEIVSPVTVERRKERVIAVE